MDKWSREIEIGFCYSFGDVASSFHLIYSMKYAYHHKRT